MSIDPFIEWEANKITRKSQECAHPCVVKNISPQQSTNNYNQYQGDEDNE